MKVNITRYISEKRPGKQEVRIDPWDTWSLDHTLSLIIHPALIQLKETKYGAPYVENEDAPDELHDYNEEGDKLDENHFKRWDWVMDEMIYAFTPGLIGDLQMRCFGGAGYDDPSYTREMFKRDEERIKNGQRLFGKYYMALWD